MRTDQLNAFWTAALLSLWACVPKSQSAVKAPTTLDTAVVTVLAGMAQGAVTDIPDALGQRIESVISDHNLKPQEVDASAWAPVFTSSRTTPHRLTWLAENAGGAPLIVLVETEVQFYSQLSGRYRWTVQVKASVASSSAPEQAVSSEFSVPVFLQYHHEKEPQALEAAAPVIDRNLGFLLDEYLGGLE